MKTAHRLSLATVFFTLMTGSVFAAECELSNTQQVVGWITGIISWTNTIMILCGALGVVSIAV